MAKKPVRAAVGDIWLNCQVCQGDLFRDWGILLNSTGMESLKLAWADENATGLIRWRRGYVHPFVNKDIKLYRADKQRRPPSQVDLPAGLLGGGGAQPYGSGCCSTAATELELMVSLG
ncbi:hypothetical protein [Streptomyces sp. NPDC051665]|uniref:hypothetical protein n=1 Tax=Streptomyces sp. NPDC051665 TaxID=3154647 RepID=UPI003427C80C